MIRRRPAPPPDVPALGTQRAYYLAYVRGNITAAEYLRGVAGRQG